MAGRVDRSQKEQLVAAGQWRAFQRRRDELKAQGNSPSDARTAALAEILPGEGCAPSDEAAKVESQALPFAPAALAGKAADEPAIVRWVARQIDVAEPDPSTCPDPFAWTLLRTCRSNPAFVPFFVEKLWAKLIPPRSQLEAAGPKVQDGKSVIELTERILAHAREAEGIAPPPPPASPRPTPSAFEAFDLNDGS